MRNAFAQEITKLAAEDERVILLTGDIGNHLFDPYRAKFPNRFFNCGIAEQNMISVAAGLAADGWRPYAYTITPFLITRCLEQIKLDICYHKLPVVLVGTGAGLAYGELGPSHHSCEDLVVLRPLPGLRIVCPATTEEVREYLGVAVAAPMYLRLGKKGEPDRIVLPPVSKEAEIALVSTGTILPEVVRAAEQLRNAGILANVFHFPVVKPLNHSYLDDVLDSHRLVISVEEHFKTGGFGASIAEYAACRKPRPATELRVLGVPDRFVSHVGGQRYLRREFGLDANSIVAGVKWKNF